MKYQLLQSHRSNTCSYPSARVPSTFTLRKKELSPRHHKNSIPVDLTRSHTRLLARELLNKVFPASGGISKYIEGWRGKNRLKKITCRGEGGRRRAARLARSCARGTNCFLGTISEQRRHSGTAICGNRQTGRAVTLDLHRPAAKLGERAAGFFAKVTPSVSSASCPLPSDFSAGSCSACARRRKQSSEMTFRSFGLAKDLLELWMHNDSRLTFGYK